jgi:hypothetical protein
MESLLAILAVVEAIAATWGALVCFKISSFCTTAAPENYVRVSTVTPATT